MRRDLLGYVVAARPWEGATRKSRPVPPSWSQSAEASHLNLSRVAATMTGSGTPCILIHRAVDKSSHVAQEGHSLKQHRQTQRQEDTVGYSTSYLERLDITPHLNDAETTWLRGFRRTQRAFHPDDPSAVPMHPSAEYLTHPLTAKGPGDSWSWPSTGASGLPRCDWEPCVDGCCLQWSKIEQSNTAVSELSYLIDHFLRPHATASKDGRADFAPFIFNHRVDGTIAALRWDSRELFLIIADNNDITT